MNIKNYSLFGGLFIGKTKFSINIIFYTIGFQIIIDSIIKVLEFFRM